MTRDVKLLIALGIALSISVFEGVLLFKGQHPEKYAADIKRSHELDTAHVERRDSSARVDSAVHTARRIGDKATKEADRIHAVADTIGQGAVTVRDSLEMWRTRDSLHVVEADSLRRRIRSDSLQILLLTRDRNDWKNHSDSVVTAMDQLRGDLIKAQADHCRIAPFVPCLSRKQSLAAGAIAGALVAANPKETAKVFRKIFTLGR